MYFSYDHEDGIGFHETAEEAKARALKSFGYDEDAAPDGWNEEVENICWGEVRQKVTETARRKADPGAGYDEHVEYALLDTANAEMSGGETVRSDDLLGEPMVHYAHKSDPNGIRFRQFANDKLPPWAVDVKPCVPNASGQIPPASGGNLDRLVGG